MNFETFSAGTRVGIEHERTGRVRSKSIAIRATVTDQELRVSTVISVIVPPPWMKKGA